MKSNSPNQHDHQYADEVSIDEFLISVKYWLRKLLQNWKIFTFLCLTCIALSLIWRSYQKPTYSATMTLMLSDDGGSSIGGMSAILGQFGIPISGGKYNIDKLIKIARSRVIIEKVLLKEIHLNGKQDLIGNHMIDLYQITNENELLEYLDPTHNSTTNNLVLIKKLYQQIIGNSNSKGLLQTDYGRDHYIMDFTFTSFSEVLSVEFLNHHFETLKSFYINKSIEKQENTFNVVRSKRDSIYNDLKETEYQLANLKDRTSGGYRNTNSVKIAELSTKSLVLKTAYVKAEENLGLIELTLKDRSPLIQIIDPPQYPIEAYLPSIIKTVIIAIICGLILSCSLLLLIYFLKL